MEKQSIEELINSYMSNPSINPGEKHKSLFFFINEISKINQTTSEEIRNIQEQASKDVMIQDLVEEAAINILQNGIDSDISARKK